MAAHLPPTTPLSHMGLTPKVTAHLHALGLESLFDLALHLPLRYEDESQLYTVASLPPGNSGSLVVRVLDHEIQNRPKRTLKVRMRDDSGELLVRFLHFFPSHLKTLAPGSEIRLYGELRAGFHGPEMIHPRFQRYLPQETLPTTLTPVYPTRAGLSQSTLRRCIAQSLECLALNETLPPELMAQNNWLSLSQTLKTLHYPESWDALGPHLWHRLKFEELVAQQLSMQWQRQLRQTLAAPCFSSGGTLVRQVESALPFTLTVAQQRVLTEIRQDLARTQPMHRLLQGDVGCGKTIIAALACVQAIEAGWQAVLMAPTELLAQQHFSKIATVLAPHGIVTTWLTGQLKTRDQNHALEQIAQGKSPLIVGTHALIQERVIFKTLGLVIIDEQHRFGVAQRLALHKKGQELQQPHQLMMSATPIPRSLSMSYYADLDVSIIDELPPGRQGIQTKLITAGRRHEVIERVRHACHQGGQAYWVCPLIEESEALSLQNTETTFRELCISAPELRCGLLHGRMPGTQKSAVMNDFLQGNLDLLVATSVIEVGVDVPNATVIVIEHAERMGLAQLHQMRGRVGRGQHAGTCLLLYQPPLGENARKRLKIIYEHTDGFEIARQDLLLRGPGDYLGARQSGLAFLRFADPLTDIDLVAQAQAYAQNWLSRDPTQAQTHATHWLGSRQPFLRV
ncbi:MAG: ATP-dependent DNA helicase RecG [Ferrovum sp.]|nr:ATP-dependent DNA helicase RecG [Ferrovum sp.]NDU87528.1 ATP-dependent DNA helicase RecG [Ferrovum sp.]